MARGGGKLARKLLGAWRKATRPSTVGVMGVEIVADAARVGADMARWIYDGKYEAVESAIVAATVRPGDRVLDCGGGLGLIACLAARAAGPSGAVAVYEPNPDLVGLIETNAATNGVQLDIRRAAVAAAAGRATFHVSNRFVASSLASDAVSGGRSIDVEVEALRDIVAAFAPSYLILDIEGAEADAFDGVDLSGVRAVCIEIHPGAVGAVAASRPLARLIDAGLGLDVKRSVKDVFYLSRDA